MFEIGRLCVKLAGRDARRKCNISHLEPLKKVIKISKGISGDALKKELEKVGIVLRETKPKTKKPKQGKAQEKPVKKVVLKEAKKPSKPTEKKPVKVEEKPSKTETKKE